MRSTGEIERQLPKWALQVERRQAPPPCYSVSLAAAAVPCGAILAMGIFSRMLEDDAESKDESRPRKPREASAESGTSPLATAARRAATPSLEPPVPAGVAKSASKRPAGPARGGGRKGAGAGSPAPSKRSHPRASSDSPQPTREPLPPLVLDSDFPPRGREPHGLAARTPTPPEKSAPSKTPPPPDVTGVAEGTEDDSALFSELEARFDASRRKSDPSGLTQAEPAPDSVTTEQDLAEVRGLFHEMAVHHMAQVRDLMLELGRVEVASSWVGLCEPTVQSVLEMCQNLDVQDLSSALEQFAASLAVAKSAPNGVVQGETRQQLLAAYERMMEILPRAFELGSGREAMLLQLLLMQVPGVHKFTIDKLYAAGLNRLDAFLNARPDGLAAVAGIQLPVAESIVKHFRDYRQRFRSVLADPTPIEERHRLAELVERLRVENDEFERARAGWTPQARADKRRLRNERRHTLSSIYVSLARLGEVDRVDTLQAKPVQRQLEELEEYLRHPSTFG
jgi:hypothetical protein